MIIFVFQTWISLGCSVSPVWSGGVPGQGVRSLNKWGETLKKFLPNFNSADVISWQRWPFRSSDRAAWWLFITEVYELVRHADLFSPLPVQRSCPPYEKTFHHKPKQLLPNHIYKYFTEAERSGGDTSDKTPDHFPLHLSRPLFFSSVSAS